MLLFCFSFGIRDYICFVRYSHCVFQVHAFQAWSCKAIWFEINKYICLE